MGCFSQDEGGRMKVFHGYQDIYDGQGFFNDIFKDFEGLAVPYTEGFRQAIGFFHTVEYTHSY